MNDRIWLSATPTEAKLFTQNHYLLNGRQVWHYLFDSAIIPINIIQYEKKDEIVTVYAGTDYESAERKFKQICNKIINGKL